ncbi:MAG: response regulator transcription factor [Anaerolineae bacterium]|nr:response regulator transcription factor [Anaerolineae bacterium]
MMQGLLLVQDPDEAAVLTLALQRVGLTISRSVNFDGAIDTIPRKPVDLIVFAIEAGIPGASSLARVRRLRGQTAVPLVMIVDLISEGEHIALLDAGADLVVIRPFSTRLLMAQLRILVRRAKGVPLFTIPTMSMGTVTLDPGTRAVQLGDAPPKRLTHLEFRLLYTLMINAEHVVPTERLVEHIWGYDGEGDRDLVRGLVRRLRAKIEPDSRHPRYILTESGIGYVFTCPLDI